MTLIKSTLIHLPTYQLSIFKAPVGICKKIEKYWRDFLWKNKNEDKLTHLLRWSKVTLSIEKGGLGIHKIAYTNFSFLCKWLWRFHTEADPLWKKIITAKYNQSFSGELPAYGKYSSLKAPWRNIIKGVDWYNAQIKWTVNNGENFSFWKGFWCEISPIYRYKPRLFALSTIQNGSIKDVELQHFGLGLQTKKTPSKLWTSAMEWNQATSQIPKWQ